MRFSRAHIKFQLFTISTGKIEAVCASDSCAVWLLKMNNTIIKHCLGSLSFVLKLVSAKNAVKMLQKMYSESSLQKTAVNKWFSHFRDGAESVNNNERTTQ